MNHKVYRGKGDELSIIYLCLGGLILSVHFDYINIGGIISLSQVMSYISILILFTKLSITGAKNEKYKLILDKKSIDIIQIGTIIIIYFIVFSFDSINKSIGGAATLFKFCIDIILFGIVPYVISINIFRRYKNLNVSKIMNFVIKLNVIIIFVQSILYNFMHIYIKLPYQVISWGSTEGRPLGLFSEPAHVGSLFICILLLDKNVIIREKRWIILSILSLILTQSPTNIVISATILIKLLISIGFNLRKLFIVCGILTIMITSGIKDSNYHIERISNIVSGDINEVDGSTFGRVYKGFIVFSNMPLDKKLIGIGIDNELESIQYSSRSKYYSRLLENVSYFSGIGYELVTYGIVGFLIINIFYYLLLGKNNLLFFIVFEILRIGTGLNYTSSILPLYIIMSRMLKNEKLKKEDLK